MRGLENTRDACGTVAIVLHWSMALLLVGLTVLERAQEATRRYGIDAGSAPPWTR